MKRNHAVFTFALLAGVGLAGALLSQHNISSAAPAPGMDKTKMDKKAGRAPVLVELFTSEGCSSCPSADALLKKLKKEQPVDGAEIIVLGEHVDYWNNRAWKDPFSSAAFSERQEGYRKALRLDSVYTPQAVVDGHTEFVGSDDDRASAAIAQAAKTAKTDVQITGETKNGTLELKIHVAPVAGLAKNDRAETLLAITEDNLHSQVAGGENYGRRLNHAAVVRELKPLGEATPDGGFTETLSVPLKVGWKRDDLQAIIFVQAQKSKRIFGAATISVK